MLAQQVFGPKSLPPGYRLRQVLEAGLLASDRGKVGSSISPPLSMAEPHQGLTVVRQQHHVTLTMSYNQQETWQAEVGEGPPLSAIYFPVSHQT